MENKIFVANIKDSRRELLILCVQSPLTQDNYNDYTVGIETVGDKELSNQFIAFAAVNGGRILADRCCDKLAQRIKIIANHFASENGYEIR